MAGTPTEITCKTCGQCCKNYPFIMMSNTEVERLEATSGLSREVFSHPHNDGHFLLFQENTGCFFLKGDVGSYYCGVYEGRPNICRSYPSTTDQINTCEEKIEEFVTHRIV